MYLDVSHQERPFIISERAIFRPVNGEKSGLTSIDKIDKTKDFVGSSWLVAAFLQGKWQPLSKEAGHFSGKYLGGLNQKYNHLIFFLKNSWLLA